MFSMSKKTFPQKLTTTVSQSIYTSRAVPYQIKNDNKKFIESYLNIDNQKVCSIGCYHSIYLVKVIKNIEDFVIS